MAPESDDPGGEIELPQLQQAVLDELMLEQLFFDIASVGEQIEVSFKGGPLQHATPPSDPGQGLLQARKALVEGTALGVQLRYSYRGQRWLDTLLRGPGGVRLVRMEAGAAAPARPVSRGPGGGSP